MAPLYQRARNRVNVCINGERKQHQQQLNAQNMQPHRQRVWIDHPVIYKITGQQRKKGKYPDQMVFTITEHLHNRIGQAVPKCRQQARDTQYGGRVDYQLGRPDTQNRSFTKRKLDMRNKQQQADQQSDMKQVAGNDRQRLPFKCAAIRQCPG